MSFAQSKPLVLVASAQFNTKGQLVCLEVEGRPHFSIETTRAAKKIRQRYHLYGLKKEHRGIFGRYVEAWLQHRDQLCLSNIFEYWLLSGSTFAEQRCAYLWSTFDRLSKSTTTWNKSYLDETLRGQLKGELVDVVEQFFCDNQQTIQAGGYEKQQERIKGQISSMLGRGKPQYKDHERIQRFLEAHLSHVCDLSVAHTTRNAMSHGDELHMHSAIVTQSNMMLEVDLRRIILVLIGVKDLKYELQGQFYSVDEQPIVPSILNLES